MRLKGLPKRLKIQFFSPSGNILRAKTLLIAIKVLGTPDVTLTGLISLDNTTSVLFTYWLVYLVYLVYLFS